MWPSSIASSRIAASASISLRIEAGPSGTTRPALRGRAGRRRRRSLARSLGASRSLCALNARQSSRVDLVEPVAAEERQQVARGASGSPGSVLAAIGRSPRTPSILRLQPGGGVLVEGRDGARARPSAATLGCSASRFQTPARTRARMLPSSRRADALVPAAAAAALAVRALVQREALARAAGAEAELEGARAVGERLHRDVAAGYPSGHISSLPRIYVTGGALLELRVSAERSRRCADPTPAREARTRSGSLPTPSTADGA